MRRVDPWGVLIALSLAISAVWAASLAARVAIPEGASRLASFALSGYLIYWVVRDARKRRRVPCHEFGFLVGIFLPFSLVWYVLWTRGWRGIFTLAGIFGVVYLPWIASFTAWHLLS